MGEVFLAWDSRYKRLVALKFLPARFTKKDDIDRFIQEGLIIFKLDHANIVKIHDLEEASASDFADTEFNAGDSQVVHFLVEEYIEGLNLREFMATREITIEEALRIAIEAGLALKEAHHKGIIHRDIKPDNVMIKPDGNVKILDFGMAKLTDWFITQQLSISSEPHDIPLVRTGPDEALGTACYMSPEQWGEKPGDGGDEIDARTDIWSLGLLLYEMITRVNPFISPDRTMSRFLICKRQPYPLSDYVKHVPKNVQTIVETALQKNRNQRYQSMNEMLVSLGRAKRQVEQRRERMVSKVIITSLVILTIGLSLLLVRERSWGTATTTGIHSIAVIPFEAAEDRDRILSQGISDSLITRLGNLKVKVYQGTMDDVKRLKESQLRDDTVLSGRIYRDANRPDERIRVSVTLKRGTQEVLNAWVFDERSTDVFKVEDDISEQTALALELATDDQRNAIRKRYTDNAEAYELYIEGRAAWDKRTQAGFEEAIEKFSQAITKDPKYALAYAGLADCYSLLSFFGYSKPEEGFEKAQRAAEKALQLDGTLAEGYASLGYVLAFYRRDWNGAEVKFKEAIQLKDNYPMAHHWYGLLLARTLRFDEANAEILKALELDRRSLIINRSLGLLFYYERRYDAAIEQYQKTLIIDNSFAIVHIYLARAYIQKQSYKEASWEIQQAKNLSPDEPSINPTLGWLYAASGRRRDALKIISELTASRAKIYASPYDVAVIYVALGDTDTAIAYLEHAAAEHSDKLALLGVEPVFESLRTNPRYQELLRRTGLPSQP